jgi:hypothetical protein
MGILSQMSVTGSQKQADFPPVGGESVSTDHDPMLPGGNRLMLLGNMQPLERVDRTQLRLRNSLYRNRLRRFFCLSSLLAFVLHPRWNTPTGLAPPR